MKVDWKVWIPVYGLFVAFTEEGIGAFLNEEWFSYQMVCVVCALMLIFGNLIALY